MHSHGNTDFFNNSAMEANGGLKDRVLNKVTNRRNFKLPSVDAKYTAKAAFIPKEEAKKVLQSNIISLSVDILQKQDELAQLENANARLKYLQNTLPNFSQKMRRIMSNILPAELQSVITQDAKSALSKIENVGFIEEIKQARKEINAQIKDAKSAINDSKKFTKKTIIELKKIPKMSIVERILGITKKLLGISVGGLSMQLKDEQLNYYQSLKNETPAKIKETEILRTLRSATDLKNFSGVEYDARSIGAQNEVMRYDAKRILYGNLEKQMMNILQKIDEIADLKGYEKELEIRVSNNKNCSKFLQTLDEADKTATLSEVINGSSGNSIDRNNYSYSTIVKELNTLNFGKMSEIEMKKSSLAAEEKLIKSTVSEFLSISLKKGIKGQILRMNGKNEGEAKLSDTQIDFWKNQTRTTTAQNNDIVPQLTGVKSYRNLLSVSTDSLQSINDSTDEMESRTGSYDVSHSVDDNQSVKRNDSNKLSSMDNLSKVDAHPARSSRSSFSSESKIETDEEKIYAKFKRSAQGLQSVSQERQDQCEIIAPRNKVQLSKNNGRTISK